MSNNNNYIEYINEQASGDSASAFISECEYKYRNKLKTISEKINDENKSIVLLAGPSSSGKTTSARLIGECLRTYGKNVFTVSLDDYYKDSYTAPLNEKGVPDFESVDALDLDLLEENLYSLNKNGFCEKPVFDFTTGRRKEQREHLVVSEGDVIVVEGLHALNNVIADHLPSEKVLKLYVNLNSRIYNEKGKIILNKRNCRFVRRMIRDKKFRASSVEYTYKLWENVVAGEEKYLFPFKDSADIKINSLHLYEPCIFRNEAIKLLEEVGKESAYYNESRELINALKQFESLPWVDVPTTSLLREFIGY